MNNKGFTLIEIILTIMVVGVIAGVSAKVLMDGIDTYSLVTSRRDAVEHARVGMDRMVSELLLVDSNDITLASGTKVSFTDANNSSTNFQRKTVQNTWELYRGDDFLAGIVGLLDFDYYRDNGNSTSWPWLVRRINIELTVQTLGGYGTIPLRTEVFPRNFMYTNFR